MSFGVPGLVYSAGSSMQGSDPNQKPVPTVGLVARFVNVPLVNAAVLIPGSSLLSPNDGQKHMFAFAGQVFVSGAETGGILASTGTFLAVNSGGVIDPGGHGNGTFYFSGFTVIPVDPNTVVAIAQTALSAGTASVSGVVAMIA